jgi:hypothetical protein
MLHLPFDEEILNHHIAIRENQSLVVQYHDPEKKNKAILQFLISQLYDNKKTLLVISEELDYKQLPDLLAEYDLDKYCLTISNNYSLSQEDLTIFKETHSPAPHLSRDIIEKLVTKLKEETKQVENKFSTLETKVFGNWNRKSLIATYYNLQSVTKGAEKTLKIKEHGLSFNKKEFWKVRKEVEQATKLYHNSFKFLDTINLYTSKFISDQLDIELRNESKLLIKRLKDRTNDIQYRLTNLLDRKIEGIVKECFDQNKLYVKQLNKLLLEFLTNPTEDKVSTAKKSFFSKKKSIEKSGHPIKESLDEIVSFYKGNTYLNKLVPAYLLDNVILSEEYIDELIDALKGIDTIDYTTLDEYLRRINKNNANDEQLSIIHTQIDELIQDVNKSEYFPKQYEHNGFTLQHQIKMLRDISSTLDLLLERNELNVSYIKWLQFLHTADDSTIRILDEIKSYHKNIWVFLFEGWYILQLLDRESNIRNNIDLDLFEFLTDLNISILGKKEQLIENNIYVNKITVRKELQKTNAKSYQKLIKKDRPVNENWLELLEEATDLITSHYPIIIIRENYAKHLHKIRSKSWDTVILDQVSNHRYFRMETIKKLSNQQLVYNTYNGRIYDRPEIIDQIDEDTDNINMVLSYPKLVEDLEELSMTDRLRFCKRIATNLNQVNPQISLYQTKNLSIISFWSSFHNSILEEQLEDLGLKEIKKESTENKIVEALLDSEKNSIVLIEDGLINSSKSYYYQWQFFLINSLQQAGVKCMNIWSHDLIDNGISRIIENVEEMKALQAQTSIEEQMVNP